MTETAEIANVAQEDYWSSPSGQKWSEHQVGLDAVFANVNKRLFELAAPKAGEAVLDIGCGAGATSLDARALVGETGSVQAFDIADAFLKLAERRAIAQGYANVSFVRGDAQVYAFEEARIDLICSRFGVMFFEYPIAAFKNMATALKPGGRIVFAAWAKLKGNPWFEAPKDAAVDRLGWPSRLKPTDANPLAFADIGFVLDILRQAGLTSCVGTLVTVPLNWVGSVEDAAFLASNIGPSSRILKEHNGTEEDARAIADEVAKSFRQYADGDVVAIPANLNFFQAFKE